VREDRRRLDQRADPILDGQRRDPGLWGSGLSWTDSGIYRYGVRGWQLSDLDEAADATYRDFTADQRPVDDAAAAARAVACIRVVAP